MPDDSLLKTTPEPQLMAWGRIPAPGKEQMSENLELASKHAALSRGLGRSYGDSSLPAAPTDKVINTSLANRILAFDPDTGVMRCEAGVSLADVIRVYMPRGFFPPVTPGTKFVTIGGMVASDVHGKNHHVDGCFGAHVRKLKMRVADESIVECSPVENPDLFYATIGGMGLLGHILEVEFTMKKIPSQWLLWETTRVADIDESLQLLNAVAPLWPMTAGWIDCLVTGSAMGRGHVWAGRWATQEEASGRPPPKWAAQKTFPVVLPNWALNDFTALVFNTGVYWSHMAKHKRELVTPEAFFWPLDAILHWNRAYGSRGFSQYQCVVPRGAGSDAVREFMKLLTKLGGASPLCVIKDCGPESKGLLSFPLEGTSIAIDMAVRPDIQRIVSSLNAFLIETGGRIYLTKDRFTTEAEFSKMEPRLPQFQAARDKWDPTRRFRSAQSVRLLGDRP